MGEFPPSDSFTIREVWKHNLVEEFNMIKSILANYPYISMDTEFPGTPFSVKVDKLKSVTPSDKTFLCVKANVERIKLIQLGLTFSDENGNLPTCGTEKYCYWQFNFCGFDPVKDLGVPSSVQFLTDHGIDLERFNREGVDVSSFRKSLVSSGILYNHNLHWWTFQSRNDFGFLLKILNGNVLPNTRTKFLDTMRMYFPNVYDIKHLMEVKDLFVGLEKIAARLKVKRVGKAHQAGSDSLLTCHTFVKLRSEHFNDGSFRQYAGQLHWLR